MLERKQARWEGPPSHAANEMNLAPGPAVTSLQRSSYPCSCVEPCRVLSRTWGTWLGTTFSVRYFPLPDPRVRPGTLLVQLVHDAASFTRWEDVTLHCFVPRVL